MMVEMMTMVGTTVRMTAMKRMTMGMMTGTEVGMMMG